MRLYLSSQRRACSCRAACFCAPHGRVLHAKLEALADALEERLLEERLRPALGVHLVV
jgi:hypothetical protein